jgi:hypothetical protein
MPTIDELKRMARRHNRATHIHVAQSKTALERDLSSKDADRSAPNTGEATPYRRALKSAKPKPKKKPSGAGAAAATKAGPAYNTRNFKKKRPVMSGKSKKK